MSAVAEIRAQLSAHVRALEPDAVPLPEVVAWWEHYDAIERHAAAAKTLLARRVVESRAWQRAGHRTAADFLASRAGSSVGAARAQLETSQKLGQCPALEQKLRDGTLSGDQTALVVEGSSANRDAEERLLRRSPSPGRRGR